MSRRRPAQETAISANATERGGRDADEARARAYAALAAWWRAAGVDAPDAPARPKQAPAPARDRAPVRARRAAPPSAPAAPAGPPAAADCADLTALQAALEAFTTHPLHAGARTTVFARGAPAAATVMVIGEAPGRDEDLAGLPFVGRSGQLLDRMFAAIGLTDQAGLYVTNIVNWRPAGNRAPSAEEIALCLPYLRRHIELVRPTALAAMGGVSAKTLLDVDQGITRLRGRWATFAPEGWDGDPIPLLPMLHPAFLLRRPVNKREAWADLLTLQARLEDG